MCCFESSVAFASSAWKMYSWNGPTKDIRRTTKKNQWIFYRNAAINIEPNSSKIVNVMFVRRSSFSLALRLQTVYGFLCAQRGPPSEKKDFVVFRGQNRFSITFAIWKVFVVTNATQPDSIKLLEIIAVHSTISACNRRARVIDW